MTTFQKAQIFKLTKTLLAGFWLYNCGSPAKASNVASDAPDPQALKAYKQFWDAFTDYENRKSKAAVLEFEMAKEAVQAAYELKDREALAERVKLLDQGIERYEKQLTTNPQATNRPYVLLNLSQMLAELASLQVDTDPSAAGLNRQKAFSTLKEIETNYPDFEYKNDALYQRAILLEATQQREAALVVWRTLTSSQKKDRYALHANLAVGDAEFEGANPDAALKYYERAGELLNTVDPEAKPIDELRIQYRIGWAAFKATKHLRAIKAAKVFLNPSLSAKAFRQRDKITKDAIELIGFSLYEMEDISQTKAVLRSPDLVKYAAAIALSAMTRYKDAGQHERVASLGSYANDQFGAARETPDILVLTANAHEALGHTIARVEALEKLAMLLPENSLWRSKFANDAALTRSMEERATQAAITVASYHYENGLAGNTNRSFKQAMHYYGILIQLRPNTPEATEWRLRRANCLLYAGQHEESDKMFTDIIDSLKVSDETLSIAMYQRTVALERMWRARMELAVQNGLDPTKDASTLAALKRLEDSVEQHANKFPNQSRSVDLLLVAASANRDQNRFAEASKFWQRSLLSSPSDVQRSMAIRGLVFAELRTGKPADIIEMVSKFLKLESSKTLAQNLTVELKGVLASAANDEAQKRAKLGQNESAGVLLVTIAKEFKNIPRREQMYRDGAYMIAIGGNWSASSQAAKAYLNEGNKQFWGDMTYLAARSAEFQMRFPKAVKTYLELAEREPRHARASLSLERAEKLAVADEDYKHAGSARLLAADSASETNAKLDHLSKACEYQIKAGDLEGALKTASRRTRDSQSDSAKLESEILLAKVRYASGERQTAIDDMDSITKQLERAKLKLGDRYAALAASSNAFLADDLKQKFSDYRISDQKDTGKAIDDKSALFAAMTVHYDKVASLDQADESPRARYALATAASDFADEIAGLPARSGEPLTLKSQNRFNQNITRLRDLAKRYHSNNILAKQRSPQLYAQSDWIRKSALMLSANGEQPSVEAKDQTTSAVHMEVPQQWSH